MRRERGESDGKYYKKVRRVVHSTCTNAKYNFRKSSNSPCYWDAHYWHRHSVQRSPRKKQQKPYLADTVAAGRTHHQDTPAVGLPPGRREPGDPEALRVIRVQCSTDGPLKMDAEQVCGLHHRNRVAPLPPGEQRKLIIINWLGKETKIWSH